MKAKTLVAMAALALLIGAPARGAEVISSNVVGYNRLSTVAGLNLFGVQFQGIGGNGEADINATMKVTGLTGFDWEEGEGGDSLYVWDPNYQYYVSTYTYAGDSVPEEITDLLGYDLSGKWMNADQEPVDEPFVLGNGLWIESASASGSVLFSGEVNTNPVTQAIGPGLNLIANPYPKAFYPNDARYTGLVGFDWEEGEGGDSLYVWDPNYQYYVSTYTYAGDSVPEEITDLLGYDLSGKWMNADQEPVDEPIPAGCAMWIESTSNNASVTFTY